MKRKQIIFIIFFIIILLTIPFITKDKNVEFTKIKEAIKPYIDSEIIKEIDSKTIYTNFGINPNLLDDYISFGPISFMNVEEITIFKEEDKQQREILIDKINDYINKKIITFEGYGPTQVELLKNSIVKTKGDYVFCIILENNEEIWKDITKLF